MYDYEIENKFFYNLTHQRASKIYAQCDIFLRTLKIKGDIAEFGVFKGNSLNRFILLRDFYAKKKIIYAFDTFKIIKTHKKDLDHHRYQKFIKDSKNYITDNVRGTSSTIKYKKTYNDKLINAFTYWKNKWGWDFQEYIKKDKNNIKTLTDFLYTRIRVNL